MTWLKNLVRYAVRRLLRDLIVREEVHSLLLAKLHVARVRALGPLPALREAEFKVYSQGGEDGIVQYLLAHVDVPRPVFVEIGVESYLEANTRFLVVHDNWTGLIVEADPAHIAFIRRDPLAHRHDYRWLCRYVTAENVNDLIREDGIEGDVGLLSIDVDGNDYWIWKALDVISPRIVICEYNSLLGGRRAVTVPYDPAFSRTRAHHSNLYYGASLAALCRLADEKGYRFVGSNRAGNNAFFVREECAGDLVALSAEEGYVESRLRESRDARGRLTYLGGDKRLAAIADCPLLELDTGRVEPIGTIYDL